MKIVKNFSVLEVTFFALIFLLSNMFLLQAVADAADDDEMKVLRMYFTEDELVISPTRTLKRLSQVAENMEIITAEDIERMNAHTLAEVLERVTGMFLSFYGHDFGSDTTIGIQGSDSKHVLVLLDGIQWNNRTEGNVVTNTVPVRIIKRIEIIKGPASSAWGSSLGGVINIVTKEAVKDSTAGGSVSASFAERGTHDLATEISADAGHARYYLYAGRQESNGLRKGRWFNNDSFYSKVNILISSDIELMFTAGYSEPHINDGDDNSVYDQTGVSITRELFTTASLTSNLSNALAFDVSFYLFKHKFVQMVDELAGTWTGIPGALLKDTTINEKSNGLTAKFVYTDQNHTAVLGADYSYDNIDMMVHSGNGMIIFYGAREMVITSAGMTKWALFMNDSISLGKLTVTPGVRHDRSTISGSFTSPSIGVTYRAARNTILRASIAKGFNAPALAATTSGGLFLDPNPDLISEKIWSYQAGLESWAANYLKVKFNLFHHDIDNALWKMPYGGRANTENDIFFNMQKSKREGVEFTIETAPYHDLSLRTGYSFVHSKTDNISVTSTDTYVYNIAFMYDDLRSIFAELAGHYIWWDMDRDIQEPDYDAFICDLNINKKIYSGKRIQNNLFLTVHNIFNGSQYIYDQKKNPARWMEAGMRVTF